MPADRVKFQDIVSSQLPRFVAEDFPLLPEFLKQYYISQEGEGRTLDLIQNLDQYVRVEELYNLSNSTILASDLTVYDDKITSSVNGNFTEGFPDTNGLIKIDDEIILYSTKTDTAFEGCTRGFSGITTHVGSNTTDALVFSTTEASTHLKGATIHNLNILFLQEFFTKVKRQVVPGFSERSLHSGLNQRNFIYGANSFYSAKGTDRGFKILFKALYGENVDVLHPSTFLFRPSDADYKVTQNFVVERISGDPIQLQNLTLFQDSTGARGSVTNVEQINYGSGQFYQIAIDYGYDRDINVEGTVYSQFEPNPKTKILNTVSAGATVFDVDSTLGFPASGKITTIDVDGNTADLTYGSKNINQFFDIKTGIGTTVVAGITTTINDKSDVRFDNYSYAYFGTDTLTQIKVRIAATLKSLEIPDETYFYEKDDTIKLKSLGLEAKGEPSQNWSFNVKTQWDVKSISLIDPSENSYQITTYDDHFLRPGYKIVLKDTSGAATAATVDGTLSNISSATVFSVKCAGSLNLSRDHYVENQILRGNSNKYPALNNATANVQNTYAKFNHDALVASNSVPNYKDLPTDPYDKSVTFSGSASSNTIQFSNIDDHGFYTGDAVYYEPGKITTTTTTADGVTITTTTESKFTGVDESVYYIKRIDATSIQLSRSRSDLFNNKVITLGGSVTDNKFTYYDFYNKPVSAQGIYREISKPITKSGNYKTTPGYSGILVNGVEILNYKSLDQIYYGSLESIKVTAGGSGYDVINPPVLSIADDVGVGATGNCAIIGSLDRIEIIDSGFDYQDTPIVAISGGNGKGATAEVNLAEITHSISFNAEFIGGNISTTNNTIGFSTFHKLAPNEKIFYKSKGLKGVGGLSTDALYFTQVVDDNTIKLHTSFIDANVGINTVDLTAFGSGVQSFQAASRKKVVSDIIVTNAGSGYGNKKRSIPTSGIITSINEVNISNHGYSTGDIVEYTAGSTPVLGLSTTSSYYVIKKDENKFSLSLIGTGNTAKDYYFDNNIITDLLSEGDGSFNYQPITVAIEGVIGISTSTNQDFGCKVQPIFRGSIDSIDLTGNGVGYGASEIINFNRQPSITFQSGKEALVTPIVNNGRIVDVIIDAGGSGYNAPPDLKITGSGSFAKLTPIISNGSVTSVKIHNGGVGFATDGTSITLTNAGSEANSEAIIKEWNINLFERDFNNIKGDDGILAQNINNTILEYSHLYAPRPLRESLYAISDTATFYGAPDLTLDNGIEKDSTAHSPLMGWAYDGNPIYGPFGYTTTQGGVVKRMQSGYEVQLNTPNRPSSALFPPGFFVEDYIFTERGDLDEHNGRFCVTPDYPDGTYAYFATINNIIDSDGPFKNYKRPVFPYLIGNSFNSEPNQFNFSSSTNQTLYDIEDNGWFRNTAEYHLGSKYSGYEYIFDSNTVKEQSINITSASAGNVQAVGVFTGGTNYKVGDRVSFNNEGTSGKDVSAKVGTIGGKVVNTVSTATTTFSNIEFVPDIGLNRFVGFSTIVHGLKNKDIVNVAGLSSYFEGFNGTYAIGVRTDNFVLTLGVGNSSATGATAYFYVSGILDYPYVRPNDILGIGTEKVKVLNIDSQTQRIRVLRAQDGTVSTAHSSSAILYENPKKFTVNVGALKTTKLFNINDELYFDPAESVGIGTTTGTGVGTTIAFSNPGVGDTQIFATPQSIYYKDHGLSLNDQVFYNSHGGTTIKVWNGIDASYKNLSAYANLYVAPLNKDFIGISSNKVGLGTSGYVGINTNTGLFYFTNAGSGKYHSFRTSLSDVITGQINKNVVTVSTATTHGLSVFDRATVSVKPITTQTITVKYDDYNRRIVFDPKNFAAGDVDVVQNTIQILNHPFKSGDKVIHTATSPAGGLADEGMYYVVSFSKDKIRLVNQKFEVDSLNPIFVDITSTSSGTISKINPVVSTNKNNKLKFDLSDSSLSFTYTGLIYPAFRMELYADDEFTKPFFTSGKTNGFEVTTSGVVGKDADANLTLTVSDYVPVNLWYKFNIENIDIITEKKREIIIDKDPSPYNQINVVSTVYDGNHVITSVGTTTFEYNVKSIPNVLSFDSSTAKLSYTTNSKNAIGSINLIDVVDGGSAYRALPGITSVVSGLGSGAILRPTSTNIGKVLTHKFVGDGIGFDYPTDETLRGVANLPEILELEALASFERIGIASNGRNYLTAPTLLVIDGYNGKIIDDIDLTYNLGDSQVSILKNTTGIYDAPPTILPIDNSNGVGISSVTYAGLGTVRLWLNSTFSNESDFPYEVGGKILIENINIGVNTIGSGYNSDDYDYTLFPVTGVNTALGGSGAYIEYSLSSVLGIGSTPGLPIESTVSVGRAIPENQFPIFDSVLKKNDFLRDEPIINIANTKSGNIESWNRNTELLKVTTGWDFDIGETIKGLSSNTQGVIKKKYEFDAEITTGAGATVVEGWQRNTGFLNDNLQKLPNNEYYQNFSYSLKSKVPFGTWDDAVGALSHTAGFIKFSDLQVETDSSSIVSTPVDATVTTITDLVGEGDINSWYDYDLVTEGADYINDELISSEVYFKNRILTDYFQSIGNRVLSIDDISDQFNSNERVNPFGPISGYPDNYTYNRIITLAQDTVYTDERQFSIVSLLQFNSTSWMNEYATLETYPSLGYYGYAPGASGWDLLWYPSKSEYNTYEVTTASLSILNNITSTGSTTGLGDAVHLSSGRVTVPAATPTTVVSIAATYRSAKLNILLEDGAKNFFVNELTLVHDGTDVTVLEYGDMSNTGTPSSSGFGTYNCYKSGSVIKVDLHPVVATGVTASSDIIAMSGSATGIGTTSLTTSEIDSSYVAIASTSSPTANIIASYAEPYRGAYYFVSVQDTTNNQYEAFEVAMCNSASNEVVVDWANVATNAGLGTVGITSVGTTRNLTFTPIASANVNVRTFGFAIKFKEIAPTRLNLNNVQIRGDEGAFRGTKLDLKTSFDLQHDGLDIFKRNFDGSSSSVVDIENNRIRLPNHFFVSAEKVRYSHAGAGTTMAIGIATATINGISTDKLPTDITLFKQDEGNIKFCVSPEKALLAEPEFITITSVGIGTSHTFYAKNGNTKGLVAIDNLLQAPVADTPVTTSLATGINFDTNVPCVGVTSFAAADLIKIDDEIMRVTGVGVGGANNLTVRRAQLGTPLAAHSGSTVVTKISGNYNIVDNVINFGSAPHGKVPLSTTTGNPDDRDWVGITTSSTFQGRTFMRRAAVGTTAEAYATNYIFDDISEQFSGVGSVFTLKSDGVNATGFSTNNAIVLVNNLLQEPQGVQAYEGAYTLTESGGISSIRFIGSGQIEGHDANISNLPSGGVLISVGSSAGYAYQPLISAGGTATVSAAGSITAVSIGNSGSGYRTGVQTTVNVGVDTQTTGLDVIENIGTATIAGGYITGVAVTNPKVFYAPRTVSNVGYTSVTGLTTVTTSKVHGLKVGDIIDLSGIALTCTYSPVLNISNVLYDNVSGVMTVTTAEVHSYTANKDVIFTGIGMTCGLDAGISTHYYPRGEDSAYNTAISIASTTATTITVDVGVGGPADQYAHNFVSASSGAVISGGNYAHTFVSAATNAVSITGWTTAFTPTNAAYTASSGNLVITTASAHGLTTSNTASVSADGLTFTCAMDSNMTNHTYPRTSDPISGIATAITGVTTNTFTINVGASPIANYNVSNASYNASTGIMELTVGSHSLTAGTSIKLATESLTFTCAKDGNVTQHKYPRKPDPYYGGSTITGVAGTNTFTVNVGTSTVATYYKSGGTVQGAILAPRSTDPSAKGTTINRVPSTTSFEVNTGVSTCDHFYARGGKVQKPLKIVFDEPMPYDDIPLEYAPGYVGAGLSATINVVVGQGSSVVDFRIVDQGYGYGNGSVLTVPVGGATGIPTDLSKTYDPFFVNIEEVYNDNFNAWSPGVFEVFDRLDSKFDSVRRSFGLTINQNPVSIQSQKGSPIEVDKTILVFLNNVLQEPNYAYTFEGGSTITFSEAPEPGDTSKIIFYKGSGDVDVVFTDILETVKVGDTLDIRNNPDVGQGIIYDQDPRVVIGITTVDSVSTNPYPGPGVTSDRTLKRPVKWSKQTEDVVVDGKKIGKDRILYEPLIYPASYILQPVGVGSTIAYVNNVRPFFDSTNEQQTRTFQNSITITSQDSIVGASATALVSIAGTISSFDITNAGVGYTQPPTVTVANPVGLGTTVRASATATVSGGNVTAISVGDVGSGYTSTSVPPVLITPPQLIKEKMSVLSYTGDSGKIVGFGTTTVGGSTRLILDLYIPTNSYMRNTDLVGTAVTVSGISTGDFFTLLNTNVAVSTESLISRQLDGTTRIGITTMFIDSTFQVASCYTENVNVIGVGTTAVRRIFTNVGSLSTESFSSTVLTFDETTYTFDSQEFTVYAGGVSTSFSFGDFSWGKIELGGRSNPQSYSFHGLRGYTGISTSGIVQRSVPLKYNNYVV